jgi:hypothetical protein
MGLNATIYNNDYKTGFTLPIRPGAIFRDEYNEVLDSGVIVITQRTTPIVISPFDIIVVAGNNFPTRRFAVDSVKERIVSFDPLIYDYQINLFSETKLLENYVLPNLSITQPADKTQTKSVGFYLQKYLELYGPKKRVRQLAPNTNKWQWVSSFVLTAETTTFFNNIECPEFQWNSPTLREVLTDLMMVADRIPILRTYNVSFIDITVVGAAVSTSNLNFVEKTITSSDAVTQLRLNMENALTPKKDNLDLVSRKVELVGFRNTNSGAYLDTTNLEIVLENPIYKLLRITMFLPVTPWIFGPFTWAEYDITNHCVEASIYNTLSSEPKSLTTYTKNALDIDKKQFNVFYSRGGRTIGGWGLKVNVGNFLFISYDEFPIESIIAYVTSKNNPIGVNVMDIVFRVEYETQSSIVADIGRTYLPNLNERTTFDNQTNAYVDIGSQGKFTQTKVNRLGNDVLMISGRYDAANLVPNLAQTYNSEYIIFSREISVFDDYVLVKFMAAKNYVLRDYFTGVSSRKRNFLLDTANSFVRHDLKKYFAEFSFVPKYDIDPFSSAFNLLAPAKLFGFTKDFAKQKPIITAGILTSDTVGFGTFPAVSTHYFGLDLDKKISGNSLLLTIAAKDNVSVGEKIVLRTVGGVANARTQETYFYANQLTGEFDAVFYGLIDEYDVADGQANFPVPGQYTFNGGAATIITNALVTKTRLKPLLTNIDNSLLAVRGFLPIYKDNKEILKLTTQIEFCADSRSIVFTDQFLKLQRFVREKDFDEIKNHRVVGKSFYSFPSDYIGPTSVPNQDLDASAYIGYSVPCVVIGGGAYLQKEFVAELGANGLPVWVDYPLSLQLPQTFGGSSYVPIHKVGNQYGTWVGRFDGIYNTVVPFWLPFDDTGVWTNANEDYIQLASTAVENFTSVGQMTSILPPQNFKGAMIVANITGIGGGVYFSLPVGQFQSGSPYSYISQNWGWVRKDNFAIPEAELLNVNRVYVSYANNNNRFRWNGSSFYSWTKNTLVGWTLYLGTTSAHLYNDFDTLPKGSTDTSGQNITITNISSSTIRIDVASNTSSVTSWGIADESGKLVIGVNGNNFTIYLNVLRKRDSRVYVSRTSDVIVGTINDTTNDFYAV